MTVFTEISGEIKKLRTMYTEVSGVTRRISKISTKQSGVVEDVPIWPEEDRVTASVGTSGDDFGAEVSIDGDTVAIAEDHAAYVFVKSGGSWIEQQRIPTPGFTRVALSGDTLVVGSITDETAKVYVRAGGVWSLQANLTRTGGSTGDRYGTSVAIEGDTVAVSAILDASFAGAVYVFTRSGSTWAQQAKVVASDRQSDDYFGNQISLSSDTLAVTAYGEDTGASAAGAVYVFTRSGGVWAEQQKLPNPTPTANDTMGLNPISLDGDTLAVPNRPANEVYVFSRSGGAWSLSATISANADSSTLKGQTLILGNSGASPPSSGVGTGAAYIYGLSAGAWALLETLRPSGSVGASNDFNFGISVSFDGENLAVGAFDEPFSGTNGVGAVYIF